MRNTVEAPVERTRLSLPEDFSTVSFRGTFRDYQATVLENAAQHLKDGKLHIVAAPGSGKTILGLECIRRLNAPTLVLSPSVTIRQQWGDRFEERFLPSDFCLGDYVSFDLEQPRLITSVTYQALHAAACHLVNKESSDIGDDENGENGNSKDLLSDNVPDTMVTVEDFHDFDLVASMEKANIQVICLDEAHHLRSEWHKALTSFIAAMGKDITIISLTATPPYDSSTAEWKRYETLCGPIDEEIFVPELVVKKTLCPHQDYIYFSYPTEDEKEALRSYRRHTEAFLSEIKTAQFLERVFQALGIIDTFTSQLDLVLKNESEFFTLFRMAERFGVALPRDIEKMIRKRKRFNNTVPWHKSWQEFECALQFVIDTPEVFTPEISEELRGMAARHGLIERRRLRLSTTSKLGRMLISSMGKLQGVSQIVISESSSLGDSLRMLVLTDYIKKDMINLIGSDATISTMGAVPIFESIRRSVGEGTRLALLSGSLVIIPNDSLEGIAAIAEEKGLPCSFKQLPNADYSEAFFQGSNKNKVSIMTEAFQRGLINILVGTKSLLGEGWDSPCINSLILATFVGSFMLSNQMRGRAIRVDGNVPDKTANIWHLVTVEPFFDSEDSLTTKLMFSGLEKDRELAGYDWDTLVRRFDCFMGPAYSRAVIESGIERIDILKPPFDRKGIRHINEKMESLSKDRATMAQSWQDTSPTGFYPVVETVTEVPATKLPTAFILQNFLPLLALVIAETAFSIMLGGIFVGRRTADSELVPIAILIIAMLVLAIPLVRGLLRVSRFLSPRRAVTTIAEAMLVSLRQTNHIKSLGAKIRVESFPGDSCIIFSLRQATIQEQNVFAEAMRETLSPIESPKYLLIKKGKKRYKYWHSYACPSVLSSNKEDAQVLCQNLTYLAGTFELVYTYNSEGRETLWRSCCFSYVNANTEIIKKLSTQSM